MIRIHKDGLAHAQALISHGKVNSGPWSYDSADRSKMLGPKGTDTETFGKYHLAVEQSDEGTTRGLDTSAGGGGVATAYKHPFGKDGEVYTRALKAIRSQTAKTGAQDVHGAAGELLAAIKSHQDPGGDGDDDTGDGNEDQDQGERSTRASGAASLNSAGLSHARSLISAGKVSTGSWSFSAADGNALLGESGDDWTTYGKCHLATSSDGPEGSKAHYKYPFAKRVGGTITLFVAALRAIRSRASQQGATGVYDAAGKLLEAARGGDSESKSLPGTDREVRCLMGELELRTTSIESNGPGTLIGYAARFDRMSNDLGGFREKIAPGAFREALRQDVRALVNHDPAQLIGRTRSGTLRMVEDHQGLRVEIDLPDTQVGRDTAECVRRGDLDGMSFGFDVAKDGDTWDRTTSPPTRTLRSVRTLHDVGPVTFPAYTDTSVALRSLDCLDRADEATRLRHQELTSLSLAKARQWLAEASLLPPQG